MDLEMILSICRSADGGDGLGDQRDRLRRAVSRRRFGVPLLGNKTCREGYSPRSRQPISDDPRPEILQEDHGQLSRIAFCTQRSKRGLTILIGGFRGFQKVVSGLDSSLDLGTLVIACLRQSSKRLWGGFHRSLYPYDLATGAIPRL